MKRTCFVLDISHSKWFEVAFVLTYLNLCLSRTIHLTSSDSQWHQYQPPISHQQELPSQHKAPKQRPLLLQRGNAMPSLARDAKTYYNLRTKRPTCGGRSLLHSVHRGDGKLSPLVGHTYRHIYKLCGYHLVVVTRLNVFNQRI